MKFVDIGEFNSFKELKSFNEHVFFKAEEYKVKENVDTINEIKDVKEFLNDNLHTKINENKRKNNDELIKETTKNVSKTIVQGTSQGTLIGGSAGAGATVVAAVVAISTLTSGTVLTDISKYFTYEVGNDYSLIEIDMDNILKEYKFLDYEVKDFSLLVYEKNDATNKLELEIKNEKEKILVPNLQVNTNYVFELLGNQNIFGEENSFYKGEFKTSKNDKPKGIFDFRNSNLIYDEENLCYSFEYSIYLSDYYNELNNVSLYVVDQECDFKEIVDPIYLDDYRDEDNYFHGFIENLTSKDLYFYLVNENEGNFELLLNEKYETNLELPSKEDKPIKINKDSISTKINPASIKISGEVDKFDNNFVYSAELFMFKGDAIEARIVEATLEFYIKDNKTKFKLESPADYGVKEFAFNIIYENEAGEFYNAYESERYPFDIDQDIYYASFNELSVNEANILYGNDYIEIEADVNFVAEYDNYFYELIVANENNVILGNYEGQGVAKIRVEDLNSLGEIKFIYKKYAYFNGVRHEFGSYETETCLIDNPTLLLGNEVEFNGSNFQIWYEISMVFDYSTAFVELILESDKGTNTYEFGDISEKGIFVFDQTNEELGVTNIKAILHFNDGTSGGEKTKEFNFGTYSLSYSYEVTNLVCDIAPIFGEISPTYNAVLNSKYILPSDYCIKVVEENLGIEIIEPVSETLIINGLDYYSEASLSVSILDSNLNIYKDNMNFVLNPVSANDNYVSPRVLSTNPGDALVTQNDDGTINIYRDVWFKKSDYPNINYNAMIYTNKIESEDSIDVTYENRFDSYVSDGYSIIENIPPDMYIFEYQTEFEFNDVTYIMYKETPSGTVDLNFNSYFTVESIIQDGSTIVTLSNNRYLKVDNFIKINGNSNVFDEYLSDNEEKYTLTLPEETNISSVYIKANDYLYSYNTLSQAIEIKGNKYFEFEVLANVSS